MVEARYVEAVEVDALLRSVLLIRDAHFSVARTGSTKERLLEEAVELIAVNGHRATSMRQIADKAGIRAASIYNHFKSKDELVTSALQWVLDDFTAFVAEPMQRYRPEPEILETLVRRHAIYQFRYPYRMHSWRIILETDQLVPFVPDAARAAVQAKRDLLMDFGEALVRAAYPTLLQPRNRVRAVNTLCGRVAWWFEGDRSNHDAVADLIWSMATAIFSSPEAQGR